MAVSTNIRWKTADSIYQHRYGAAVLQFGKTTNLQHTRYCAAAVCPADWGRVYYTNFLSCCALLLIFPACTSEHELLRTVTLSTGQIVLLVLSCAVGVCMSHAGYLMRSNVSATAGVVVGVVCKIGSVLLNLMIWDQHASPIQLCFLGLGLAGGSLFQQAPLRPKPALSKLPLAAQDMHVAAKGDQNGQRASKH